MSVFSVGIAKSLSADVDITNDSDVKFQTIQTRKKSDTSRKRAGIAAKIIRLKLKVIKLLLGKPLLKKFDDEPYEECRYAFSS